VGAFSGHPVNGLTRINNPVSPTILSDFSLTVAWSPLHGWQWETAGLVSWRKKKVFRWMEPAKNFTSAFTLECHHLTFWLWRAHY